LTATRSQLKPLAQVFVILVEAIRLTRRCFSCFLGILFGFLLSGSTLRAATILVTSTANDGPGSLRSAILAATANGTTEKDTILFALTGSGSDLQTIQLSAELPPLPSNLLIDGSSSTGPRVPRINAGVILNFTGPLSFQRFHFFRILEATDITIRGIAFQNLLGPFQFELAVAGIQLRNASRIQIGEEEKGNLFSGAMVALVNETRNGVEAGFVRDVRVVGNIVGLNTTLSKADYNGIYLANAKGLMMEKNLFVNTVLQVTEATNTDGDFISFTDNQANNIDGQPILDGTFLLRLDGVASSNGKTLIENNFLYSVDRAIELKNIQHPLSMRANFLGSSSSQACAELRFAITVTDCKDVTIGTSDGEGTNRIRGSIWQYGTGKMIVWQNQLLGELHPSPTASQGTNTITYFFENILKGKTDPGAVVQLYGTNCSDPCPLKTYINAATADAEGNWTISHNFLAGAYYLTVTKNGQTGTLQPMANQSNAIRLNDISITADTCEANTGSLELTVTDPDLRTVQLQWTSATGESLGTESKITGLTTGNYFLVSKLRAGACETTLGPIQVPAITLQFPPAETREIWTDANADVEILMNAIPGLEYFLFDADSGFSSPIDSSLSGIFFIKAGSYDNTYFIKIKKGNCWSETSTILIRIRKAAGLYFPSAFSPDGDGRNDFWKPITDGSFELYKLRIYNRLGQLVFDADTPELSWDGRLRGQQQATGIYIWVLEAKDRTSVQIRKKGQLLLIR
jgi:gliding motility-associated-like protein